MVPIGHTFADIRMNIGVVVQGIQRLGIESELIEVLAAYPFLKNVALPVDLDDRIVQQLFIRDVPLVKVFVAKN